MSQPRILERAMTTPASLRCPFFNREEEERPGQAEHRQDGTAGGLSKTAKCQWLQKCSATYYFRQRHGRKLLGDTSLGNKLGDEAGDKVVQTVTCGTPDREMTFSGLRRQEMFAQLSEDQGSV